MSKLSVKVKQVKEEVAVGRTKWEATKDWFHNSATILLARTTAMAGVVTATVGAFDWSPLWTVFTTGTSFNKQQLIMIGVGVIGMGITTEIARRRTL